MFDTGEGEYAGPPAFPEWVGFGEAPWAGEPPWSTTAWVSNPANSPCRSAIRRPRGPDDRVRVGARFCDYDLRTVEVYDVDADLVRVQQFITELCERYFLAPDSTLTITGLEVTATIAFDAICELLDESLDILKLFTPGHDRTKLTGRRTGSGAPASDDQAAAGAVRACHSQPDSPRFCQDLTYFNY